MEKSICNRRDQVKNTDEGAISLFLTVPASIKSGFEAKNLICNRRGMLAGGNRMARTDEEKYFTIL